jgi:hypothetical protein
MKKMIKKITGFFTMPLCQLFSFCQSSRKPLGHRGINGGLFLSPSIFA